MQSNDLCELVADSQKGGTFAGGMPSSCAVRRWSNGMAEKPTSGDECLCEAIFERFSFATMGEGQRTVLAKNV
jgi:hypothetical protein